jgi:abhydrolase domain-containing protein 6
MKKSYPILCALLLALIMTGCASVEKGVYDLGISAERSLSHMKAGFVTVDSQTIAYLERPGAGETIVLLHGFGANKDNWVRFVRSIPKEYRVIALDLPGHGDSSKLMDKTYDIDFIEEGFAHAADALGLTRFHIAGNSMGGYVSMLYTARNPQRIQTMCLMDTAGIVSPQPSDLQLALLEGRHPLTPVSEEEFYELLKFAFYKKPFIPWPVTSVLARMTVESSAFNRKMWDDIKFRNSDMAPLLPGFHVPVLVVWGDRDRITHVSATEVLKRSLPDSKLVIMEDCGHMPMLERPKETARHYVSFLMKHRITADPGGSPGKG